MVKDSAMLKGKKIAQQITKHYSLKDIYNDNFSKNMNFCQLKYLNMIIYMFLRSYFTPFIALQMLIKVHESHALRTKAMSSLGFLLYSNCRSNGFYFD